VLRFRHNQQFCNSFRRPVATGNCLDAGPTGNLAERMTVLPFPSSRFLGNDWRLLLYALCDPPRSRR